MGSGSGYVAVIGGPGGMGSTLLLRFGEAFEDRYGFSVGGGINVDGDTLPRTNEVLVGAPNFDDAGETDNGRVYVLSISGNPLTELYSRTGDQDGEGLGWDVQGLGNFNDTGNDDFAAGSRYYDSLHCGMGGEDPIPCPPCTTATNCFNEESDKSMTVGRVYVYEGSDGSVCLTVIGEHFRDSVGMAIGRIGDVGGTGRDDLLTSALRWNTELVDPPDPVEPGRIYVFTH